MFIHFYFIKSTLPSQVAQIIIRKPLNRYLEPDNPALQMNFNVDILRIDWYQPEMPPNPFIFFRANRQTIININAIQSVKPFGNKN